MTFEGTGHAPQGREPVALNRVLDDVLTGATGPRPRDAPGAVDATTASACSTCRRRSAWDTYDATSPSPTSCASSDPGWRSSGSSQSPVTDFLERAGEQVHPASAWLASESGHIESESGEHDLHAFQAIRRMDEILVANFMVFDDLVRERDYDLVGRRRGLGPRPLPAREPRASSARRSPG